MVKLIVQKLRNGFGLTMVTIESGSLLAAEVIPEVLENMNIKILKN